MEELHFPCAAPTVIYIDNKSAIALAGNPISSNHTKHDGAHFHPTHKQVDLGTIRLTYVPSEDNHADILTKPQSTDPPLSISIRRLGFVHQLPPPPPKGGSFL